MVQPRDVPAGLTGDRRLLQCVLQGQFFDRVLDASLNCVETCRWGADRLPRQGARHRTMACWDTLRCRWPFVTDISCQSPGSMQYMLGRRVLYRILFMSGSAGHSTFRSRLQPDEGLLNNLYLSNPCGAGRNASWRTHTQANGVVLAVPSWENTRRSVNQGARAQPE